MLFAECGVDVHIEIELFEPERPEEVCLVTSAAPLVLLLLFFESTSVLSICPSQCNNRRLKHRHDSGICESNG